MVHLLLCSIARPMRSICCLSVHAGYFHDQEVDEFDRMMRLNYLGTVHSVKAVYDSMVKRNSGYIVMVSSTLALLGELNFFEDPSWRLRVLPGWLCA